MLMQCSITYFDPSKWLCMWRISSVKPLYPKVVGHVRHILSNVWRFALKISKYTNRKSNKYATWRKVFKWNEHETKCIPVVPFLLFLFLPEVYALVLLLLELLFLYILIWQAWMIGFCSPNFKTNNEYFWNYTTYIVHNIVLKTWNILLCYIPLRLSYGDLGQFCITHANWYFLSCP